MPFLEDFLVERARWYATGAHAAVNQRRKYTNEAYIIHPEAVVAILKGINAPWPVLAAGWLHDVLEDTKVSFMDLSVHFPSSVTGLVSWVTDEDYPPGAIRPNRKKRKDLDKERLAKAPPWAQTLKVADLLDNTKSITAHDPDFAVVYMREKRSLLEVLTKADAGLRAQAWTIVDAYFEANPSQA